MRLAPKIFLANAVVILILVGVAAWTLTEVAGLIGTHRDIVVRAADVLRVEASLRERVGQVHRFEMRALVFGDREYATVSSQEAGQIEKSLNQLHQLLTTDAERAQARQAIRAFANYRATVGKARELRARGDASGASRILETEARPAIERVAAELDALITLTQAALYETQTQAKAALGQAKSEAARLRERTWNVVIIALIAAVITALLGTGVIAVRMTRSLRRVATATEAIAEGSFRAPIPVETTDEIGALARSFNRMAERLREIDALKEQFYATMSHELRSPLTSAREAAHLLEQGGPGPLTPKQEKLVSIIHRSTDRLLRLVSQVLDLSRLSAGLLPLEHRPLGLDRVVRRAVKELRVQAEEKGVTLGYECGPGTFDMVGDEDRIVQVLINLVANGIRFTPAGGSVMVRLADAGSDMEIQVGDTGVGIPPDALPFVFERFRQAHSGKGGTGLGLAIARGLVEAHGGRVSVESQEGKGTRFVVVLPRQVPTAIPEATTHPT